MSNSIDDVLNKMTPEARAKAQEAMQQFQKTVTHENNQTQTPPQTPSQVTPQPKGLDGVQPNAETVSKIQSVEKGQGNNYENAVDRALAKTSNPPAQQQKEQDKER